MENEELKWMANCIRRFCMEQTDCESCCFAIINGLCNLRRVPKNWNGYEEKIEFAISTVAKNATTTKKIELVEE